MTTCAADGHHGADPILEVDRVTKKFGELMAICTDPPTKAYRDSKFIVPRWIK